MTSELFSAVACRNGGSVFVRLGRSFGILVIMMWGRVLSGLREEGLDGSFGQERDQSGQGR